VASGRQVRRPIRAVSTWLLAITRFKALPALRRRKDLELNEEAASAIEDSSDDPEVAVPPKNTSDALRKCLTVLTADQCAQDTRRTA